LAALFVLLAVAATLLAMWTPAVAAAAVRGPYLVGYTVCSAMGWGIVGGFVGLYHHRRGIGILVGAVTGVAVGVFIGPSATTPGSGFPSLVLISLVGSAVLVVIGVVSRLTANRRQSPP
jgi:hypothetical protein